MANHLAQLKVDIVDTASATGNLTILIANATSSSPGLTAVSVVKQPSLLLQRPLASSPAVLVAVSSSPDHTSQRAAIRKTWMQYLSSTETLITDSRKANTDVRFFIGEVYDLQVDEALKAEAVEFGDITRLDFHDSYENLTIKTVKMFGYARDHSFQSMFKTDDDSFVRLDRLWERIDSTRNLRNYYAGHCSRDFPVNTDPQSKNYMGDTYPGHETLPLLCHGGGYLVGNTLFSYILDNQKNLVMHRNEDVAVTLWLRGENSAAPPSDLEEHLPVTFYWDECNTSSVYLNPTREDDMQKLWSNIHESSPNVCAHDFQLQEYRDMLKELESQNEQPIWSPRLFQ